MDTNEFGETSIDSAVKEELIESIQDFIDNSILKLTSKDGFEKIKKRRGVDFNKEQYMSKLLDAKKRSSLIIEKLENKQWLSQVVMTKIKEGFELIFVNINSSLDLYDDEEFCENLEKKFEKLKSYYKKLYPESNFGFDSLRDGKSPYKE